VDVYTTSTVPKYQAPYVATDVDTTDAIPTVFTAYICSLCRKTCRTPNKAEIDYFRGGVSQTNYIGNKCLIYIYLM
jgi:hypothetical protein